MPSQSHSGITGTPWHRCDRCGTDQRVSDLIRQQGLLVCRTFDCIDNESIRYRDRIKAEVIGSGPDAPLAPILTETGDDEIFDQI